MPIPPFQDEGLLPPGLHLADMDEIAERFGKTPPRRKELFERLRVFVELAGHCGALRMFVNGSFITAKPEPGDVDVVIWLGSKYLELLKLLDKEALRLEEILDTREPEEAFSVFEEIDWNDWINFFSLVREYPNKSKGLVEVKLR
jgi:hypothetical protein